MGGAVPPPKTATPADNELSEKKLLWGAVPPPTMTAEIGLPKPENRTVPTSQTARSGTQERSDSVKIKDCEGEGGPKKYSEIYQGC